MRRHGLLLSAAILALLPGLAEANLGDRARDAGAAQRVQAARASGQRPNLNAQQRQNISQQRQTIANNRQVQGGRQVNIDRSNVNRQAIANRQATVNRNQVNRLGVGNRTNIGNTVVVAPNRGPSGPVFVNNGRNNDWNMGGAIASGIVAGAVGGLVAGAVSGPTVVAAPPPQTVVVTSGNTAAANDAAARAEAAAAQAATPPGNPSGGRFPYGTQFAQPLPECVDRQLGPIAFSECGRDWLQPVMQGGVVIWVAVPPPQAS